MATSSFYKDFTLDSKKAADSFTKIISTPAKSVKIDRICTSPERERQSELRLKQILSLKTNVYIMLEEAEKQLAEGNVIDGDVSLKNIREKYRLKN